MQSTTDSAPLAQALANWKPWAALPRDSDVRVGLLEFLTANTADTRRAALAKGTPLFALHEIYRSLNILRPEPGEKAKEFATLLATPNSEFASAVRNGGAPQLLGLLQSAFEFGRAELHPKYEVIRHCLLEMWKMKPGSPSMKYALYPGQVLNSGGGKTHEEMAREFVAKGAGSGLPQVGGQIERKDDFTFIFDMSSTAFRANGIGPQDVSGAILRWTRVTGADDSKAKLVFKAPNR